MFGEGISINGSAEATNVQKAGWGWCKSGANHRIGARINSNMATLTEISFYSRQAIKWGIVGIVIIAIIPFAYRAGKGIYLRLRPPPPPPPTVRYGKLPKIEFPEVAASGSSTYKLETIEGGLPKLVTVGNVYVVGINKSRLLELERAKAKAKTLGFTNEPIRVDDQTYRFVHPILRATFTVNLLSGGFKYRYDFLQDKSVFEPENLPSIEQAGAEAKNFLQSLGLLPADLASGAARSTYLIATYSGEMKAAPSYSEANFVRTDLYRADKDKLRFVTVGGDTSPVNMLFSGAKERNKRIVSADYQYSTILGNDLATYPLKSVDQAWSELTQGVGFVTKDYPEVTIRRVSLAYFESDKPQQFIQPVFVFEGDGGFVGYVSAVDPKYIQ